MRLSFGVAICSALLATIEPLLVACTDRKSSPAPPAGQNDSGEAARDPTAHRGAPPPIVEPTTSRLAPPPVVANGPCPTDAVHVDGFCIDRYEAPNEKGEYPLVMESAASADAWCSKRDKRLCTEDEWERACAGPDPHAYPYGGVHEEGRCADEKAWIAKDEPTITTWPDKSAMGEVTRLYQAEKSGARAGCASAYGVYDMIGNVEEWVVSRKASARPYTHVLKGCYWSGCYGGSKPTCTSTNAAHADTFKFYETGFRCCADARASNAQ